MLIWGVIWGAVLGLLWPGRDVIWPALVGGLLGLIAGLSLRRAVRGEISRQQRLLAASALPAAAVNPSTATADTGATAPPPAMATHADRPGATPAASVPPDATGQMQTPDGDTAAPAPALPRPPGAVGGLFAGVRGWLLGGNTIVRVGVLVLFVGLSFLAKYAIDHALLPPELRLAGVGAAGLALFAGGLWLRARRPGRDAYALTLQGAGVAVLYLTVFAAFRLYQFLPAGMAFVLLALVCALSTAIALLQNAAVMAFIGFAGGFAAPLLISTGQGSHVTLFGYYLVLNLAIAGIAWHKAWRALNLLGFFATFGIATAWGVLRYRPEQFASTEPFLVAFFLIYVLASLLYALRHALAAPRAVDATLIFGTPLVAFGLQAALVRPFEYATAFSALALGAFYLALGAWQARGRDDRVRRWLAECFVVLGIGFVTLAVPLALDARWTSAVWAAEGAAIYWMGRRQQRWLARLTGMGLQLLAAGFYLHAASRTPDGAWPLANPAFVGGVLLAGSALALAWWSRDPVPPPPDSPPGRLFTDLENRLSPLWFWVGFIWWQLALTHEIGRAPGGVAALDAGMQPHLHMLAWVASAFVLHHLALPARARPWGVAASPAWLVLPGMLLSALQGAFTHEHVFAHGGWLAWPLALLLHALMLRRLDGGPPRGWWPWVHAGGVWLLVLLAGNLLLFAIDQSQLRQTAWAGVILLVAATLGLLTLSRRAWFDAAPHALRWPLGPFASAYLWRGAAPLALALGLGSLLVALQSDGDARPLPYVPLLNPTDLALALALASVALWLSRLRASPLAAPAWARGHRPPLALAAVAFVALNTVWLRVVHHFAGVPWDADLLFDSFLVQAGYSILWTLLALALMVGAHRRAARGVWMGGAALLALTLLKLLLIDLSNRGGGERIVVFIAVGALMLVVGYFAPIPPGARPASPADKPAAA